MTAKVHTVAIVTRGTRNTADVFAFLKNDRLDVGLLEKLICRSQTRRSRADDYSCFLFAHFLSPKLSYTI